MVNECYEQLRCRISRSSSGLPLCTVGNFSRLKAGADMMHFIEYRDAMTFPKGFNPPSPHCNPFRSPDGFATNKMLHTMDSRTDSADSISRDYSPVGLTSASPESRGSSGAKRGAKRSRKTQACDRCRSRKVRCDASVQTPCSRCERDCLQCIVRPHERG